MKEYVHLTRFQRWAVQKLEAAGFSPSLSANWVQIDGRQIMTYTGVENFIQEQSECKSQ